MSESVLVKLTRKEANVVAEVLGRALQGNSISLHPVPGELLQYRTVDRAVTKIETAAMGPTFRG